MESEENSPSSGSKESEIQVSAGLSSLTVLRTASPHGHPPTPTPPLQAFLG
jgi:hypothetical protein